MIISLLTDFGTRDYFAGALKGAILTINPKVRIVDISHEIEPHNIRSAGFVLAKCYRDFPHQTVFVYVVDPGVGSDRAPILVKTDNYFFVGPDNGLLSFVLTDEGDYRIFELTNEKFFKKPVSRTFHGRDIFGPVAAWLTRKVDPAEFGPEVSEIVRFEVPILKPLSNDEFRGEIVHIDAFGNLITNIKDRDIKGSFEIDVNDRNISRYLQSYSEARTGEIFTIVGSTGYLEIVANQRSAAEILNVRTADGLTIKFS